MIKLFEWLTTRNMKNSPQGKIPGKIGRICITAQVIDGKIRFKTRINSNFAYSKNNDILNEIQDLIKLLKTESESNNWSVVQDYSHHRL